MTELYLSETERFKKAVAKAELELYSKINKNPLFKKDSKEVRGDMVRICMLLDLAFKLGYINKETGAKMWKLAHTYNRLIRQKNDEKK